MHVHDPQQHETQKSKLPDSWWTQNVFVSPQTGILHGAGLWQLPKQLCLPTEEKSAQAPNSHLKYVWYGSPCSLFLRSGTYVLAFCFSWTLSRICCSISLPSLSSFLLSCLKNLSGFISHFEKRRVWKEV